MHIITGATLSLRRACLRDSVAPERFDALMPNALGISWGSVLGTLSVIMHQTQTYF
jgi:hypothetical protein